MPRWGRSQLRGDLTIRQTHPMKSQHSIQGQVEINPKPDKSLECLSVILKL
jgi:hypothetical protein